MTRAPLSVLPVSLDIAFGEPEENLRRIEAAARAARGKGETLLLLPELALTGFVTKSPRGFALSHPYIAALGRIAKESRVALAAGFPERNPRDQRPFNALALFGADGRLVAKYRKMHLFTLGSSPETASYSAGDTAVLATYRGWRIGLSICFDLRFARLYHAYARASADLILAPACWVGGPHKSYQFKTLGSAHAILSQAYVAAVNRKGRDPSFEYDGKGYVFSPFGEDVLKGKAVSLEEDELLQCRRLAVRTADRKRYPLKLTPAS